MEEREKKEPTESETLKTAFLETEETGKPVTFSLGTTELTVGKIDGNLEVGLKDPKEAAKSPTSTGDLNRAVQAANAFRGTASKSTERGST